MELQGKLLSWMYEVHGWGEISIPCSSANRIPELLDDLLISDPTEQYRISALQGSGSRLYEYFLEPSFTQRDEYGEDPRVTVHFKACISGSTGYGMLDASDISLDLLSIGSIETEYHDDLLVPDDYIYVYIENYYDVEIVDVFSEDAEEFY